MENSGIRKEAAGGVVLGEDGRVLLVEQHGNSWSFPKGGIEEGESRLVAALREIGEETGIRALTLICELGSYERRSIGKDGVGEDPDFPSRMRTMFLFRTSVTLFVIEDTREITNARFVTLDEAHALLTHPRDKEFLASVRDTIEECLKQLSSSQPS